MTSVVAIVSHFRANCDSLRLAAAECVTQPLTTYTPASSSSTMSHKYTPKEVREFDAADQQNCPATRVNETAHFTLAGKAALNAQLLSKLSDTLASGRTEWELKCPVTHCNSFLGFWICAPADVPLSDNQIRKNRNTDLMAKSHFKKFHTRTQESHSTAKKRKCQDNENSDDEDLDVESAQEPKKPKTGSIPVAVTTTDLKKAAEAGDFAAQINLAERYAFGDRVHQSWNDAYKWYTKAADQGANYAQFRIGQMYDSGDGVSQSHTQAAEWYRRASSLEGRDRHRDDPSVWSEIAKLDAQYNLSCMYLKGDGVPKSSAQAVALVHESADQGHKGSQHLMGNLHFTGDGVIKSVKKAMEWWTKAAKQEYLPSKISLSFMAHGHDEVKEALLNINDFWTKMLESKKAVAESRDSNLESGSESDDDSCLESASDSATGSTSGSSVLVYDL
jgi:TPR repeat protein